MEYGRSGAWEVLADLLARVHTPVPAAHCGLVRCEPGWSWTPSIRDYDLWLVLGGRGHGQVESRRFNLSAGTLVTLRPGDRGSFSQHIRDRLTVAWCHFDFLSPGDGQRVVVQAEWLPSRVISGISSTVLGDLLRKVVRLRHDQHPMAQLERRTVFMSAMLEVYRQDARAAGHPIVSVHPRLQDVLDVVRNDPGRRMQLAEAASIAGLSSSHFSRVFSQQLGISFRQFLIEARLGRANDLLRETPMTVAEIAKALGYEDPFVFSRQFRARYGLPPSDARAGG